MFGSLFGCFAVSNAKIIQVKLEAKATEAGFFIGFTTRYQGDLHNPPWKSIKKTRIQAWENDNRHDSPPSWCMEGPGNHGVGMTRSVCSPSASAPVKGWAPGKSAEWAETFHLETPTIRCLGKLRNSIRTWHTCCWEYGFPWLRTASS